MMVYPPLTDAGLMTYTAVLPSLVPGTTAMVIGIGGLGLLAVQFLRSLCAARLVAVDTAARKTFGRKLHLERGSDCRAYPWTSRERFGEKHNLSFDGHRR